MKTVAERVAHARQLRGLSQSELARRIKLRPQTIQSIEAGVTKKSKYLPEIAKVTQVNLEWLADGIGAIQGDDSDMIQFYYRSAPPNLRHLFDLVAEYSQKPPNEVTRAVKILEALLYH